MLEALQQQIKALEARVHALEQLAQQKQPQELATQMPEGLFNADVYAVASTKGGGKYKVFLSTGKHRYYAYIKTSGELKPNEKSVLGKLSEAIKASNTVPDGMRVGDYVDQQQSIVQCKPVRIKGRCRHSGDNSQYSWLNFVSLSDKPKLYAGFTPSQQQQQQHDEEVIPF